MDEDAYRLKLTPLLQEAGGDGEAWTEDDERQFQNWYWLMSRLTETSPDPDDPLHYYDYRAAYQGGATPEISPEDGLYHWPSTYKREGHPNLIVGGMDTRTMTPADESLRSRARNKRLLTQKAAGLLDLSDLP